MEPEKLPVTLSEFTVLGGTNEDTSKVTLESLSCGADAVAVSQIHSQVGFLRSLSPGSESSPLSFCRKVKVIWC